MRAIGFSWASFNRRAKLGVLACAAALIGPLFAAPFAATSALAKCQPNRTDNGVTYFDGWYNDAAEVDGVYSTILNYSPWVQPSSTVAAWSMLTQAGGGEYAQVGWLEFAYGTRYTFAQWTVGSGGYQTKFWSPESTGSYTTYVVDWTHSADTFTFQLNGNSIDTEVSDFFPQEAQVMGEIQTLADQMPGGGNDSEDFSNTAWYVGGWGWFNGSPYDSNGGYFNFAKYSVSDFQINDQACSY